MGPFIFSLLLLDAAPASTSLTTLTSVLTGISALNAIGVFGLIFHVGKFMGRDGQWKENTEAKLIAAEQSVTILHAQELTQERLKEMVSTLQRDLNEHRREMKEEITSLRKRSHELAGVVHQVLLRSTMHEVKDGSEE